MENILDTLSVEDRARAIIRASINTLDEQLNNMLNNNKLLKGLAVYCIKFPNVFVKKNTGDIDNFTKSINAINNTYFLLYDDKCPRFINQVMYVLGYKGDLYKQVAINIANANMGIFNNTEVDLMMHESLQRLYASTINYVNALKSQILTKEAEQCEQNPSYLYIRLNELKNQNQNFIAEKLANEQLFGQDPKYSKNVYSKEQLVTFVKMVLNKKDDSSILDFLDLYSLLNYYIFRKGIQVTFCNYLNTYPDLTREDIKNAFEDIVSKYVDRYSQNPTLKNLFNDKKLIKLAHLPIGVNASKTISRTITKYARDDKNIINQIIDCIDQALNKTVPTESSLHVGVGNLLITNTPTIDKQAFKGFILNTDQMVLFPLDRKDETLRVRLDLYTENLALHNLAKVKEDSINKNCKLFGDMEEYEEGKKYLPDVPHTHKPNSTLSAAQKRRQEVINGREQRKLKKKEDEQWQKDHQLTFLDQ